MVASSSGELLSSITRPVIDRDLDEVRAFGVALCGVALCVVPLCGGTGFSFGAGPDSCAFAPIARARAKIRAIMKTLFIRNILSVEPALKLSFVFVVLFA